ncbi:helix-turn-helix domain-containing protein [Kitasatospora sp. NBC_00458]|uniref:helix-turn-helix domain-containing protein n=1 Tax=Kitasatospora sp. NBC_00458 TaxID=2903568 RepID=UPI002E195DD0
MGSAWKKLPDELSAPARRLTEELRAVKDTTGLSLSELATRTHYSRASWERWLNGKRIVTEQALEALIGAVECNGPKLRALWEATAAGAAEPTAGGATPEPETEPGTESEPEPGTAAAGSAAGPVDTGEGTDAGAGADTGTDPAAEAAEPVEALDAVETAPGDPTARRAPARWFAVAASVVVAALLVLAGVRYSSGGDREPTASEQPAAPSPSPSSPPAKTAPAVAGCQAVGCAHKDPKATGCGADARTLQTTNIGKVVVYLRYSQKCQAAWAAITEGKPGDQAVVTTSAGETETALIHWGYDNYSAMVNAADPAVTLQVCGKQSEGESCTNTVSDLARLVASTPIPIGPASPPPRTTPPAAPAESAAPAAGDPAAATPAAGTPAAATPAS